MKFLIRSLPSQSMQKVLAKLGVFNSNFTKGDNGKLYVEFPAYLAVSAPRKELDFTFFAIRYAGRILIKISEKNADQFVTLDVYSKRILQLENEGQLPEQQKQKQLIEKSQQACKGYMAYLEKEFPCGELPEKPDKLQKLAHAKYEIVVKANDALRSSDGDRNARIKACEEILTSSENLKILSTRRDSWQMDVAKIVGSLGTILIYRWLMGDKVTKANALVRDISLFAQKDDGSSSSDSSNHTLPNLPKND